MQSFATYETARLPVITSTILLNESAANNFLSPTLRPREAISMAYHLNSAAFPQASHEESYFESMHAAGTNAWASPMFNATSGDLMNVGSQLEGLASPWTLASSRVDSFDDQVRCSALYRVWCNQTRVHVLCVSLHYAAL